MTSAPELPSPDNRTTGAPLAHADRIARLTLEQKASLVSGADMWHTQGVPDAGVASVMVTDGPHGLRKADADAVGIGTSNPATCFPPAVALASSWDADLVRRVGVAIGDEARAEQIAVVLGPGINIKRSPLCGRNFEYASEDPFVAGVFGAAMVEGIQSRGIGTSLKHFAANNQETDRMRVSADVDERTLREIYLAAFEHVVKVQQPTTVMCSYNKINGVYSSQNHWLLTDVLRGEWGFEGLVVSDWGAVSDPAAAVAAGLDLEMPPSGAEPEIVEAVRGGTLDEGALDLSVDRLLTLLDRTGAALAASDPALDTDAYDAHHDLAREAARGAAVLLENDGVLPLDPASDEHIAVIGAFASEPRYQGAGSSQVVATRVDDALAAIRDAAGEDRVTFAQGFRLDGEADAALHDAAVAAAREADVVLVFLGLPSAAESEGYDRTTLSLPDDQLLLLEALQGVSDRIVVVLSNGSAVSIAEWRDGISAIFEGWLLGQAGGSATADLLFGAASPSGRLTETLPMRIEDTPAYLNFPGGDGHVLYGEGVHVGYRYYDTLDVPVVYPFGHGLTYTTFAYDDVRADAAPERGENSWDVHVTVTNTGRRAGAEVAQVYVHDVESRVRRPRHELRGFARVELVPGESVDVVVPLDDRAFAFWSVTEGRWEIEPGEFVIEVGASSRDIQGTATVTSPGDGIGHRLDASSTLGEWLSDDVGAQVLMGAIAAAAEAAQASGDDGAGAGPGAEEMTAMLASGDTMAEMMKQMPIGKIVSFTGMVTREQLDELVGAYEAARTS